MLNNITMRFSENSDLKIPIKGITIFVGPNNSGKSLVLRELELIVSNQGPTEGLKIVKDFEFSWPNTSEIDTYASNFSHLRSLGESENILVFGKMHPNGGAEITRADRANFLEIAASKQNKYYFSGSYLKWGVLRLDGRSRFNLTNDQPGGDLLAPPQNVLSHLFQNDAARFEVRSMIKDAFGVYFTIDPTQLGTLRIRLSPIPPPVDEQSLNF